MKTRKKFLIALSMICVFLIGAIVIAANIYMNETSKKVESIVFESIDLSQVADGEYEGAYDAGLIYAKVKVQVKSGKLTRIKILEHKTGKGGPAESIVDQIVSEQSLSIDNVSGATGSSKSIKKAVEIALKKGIQ